MELAAGIEPATSPLPRECSTTEPRKRETPLFKEFPQAWQRFLCRKTCISSLNGAGDVIRTRDIQLGRLALYQLSYTRTKKDPKVVARGGFEPPKG